MKFGVFFLLERPPWKTQAQPYAEELGYDSAWLAEHHFSEYGICPSMAVLAGALAQRTRRVRFAEKVLPTFR
jgi:alkanesulfonate monooxygenase SsuD/methylene tetrahydromethanopterin reductase-like flavin-dependent oxidoreductase (luciferase family)